MKYDVIIIGLGAMGSAAAYQLSKTGKKVLGIDQFSPPHSLGSTHGDTRITRQAIGEGEQYVPLVLRSYEIWDELEKLSGKSLLTKTGGLILGMYKNTSIHHNKTEFLATTIKSAEKFGIKHRVLYTHEIKKEFPQFNLHGDEVGYYEDNMGFLRPELCVKVQLQLASQNGGEIHTNEKVLDVSPQGGTTRIKTLQGSYEADKVIISAGSWVPMFLPEKYHSFLKVYRQVLFWFDPGENYHQFTPDIFPTYIWEFTDGTGKYIYGFPAIDGPSGGVKVASEQYVDTTDPDRVQKNVTSEEIQAMYNTHVKDYLPGLSSTCLRAKACLYTVTPDSDFVIDFHPDYRNIIIASPCSGHGFKHSAAIGQILAELALEGKSSFDISQFSFKRFQV